jgi:hypothetical protein
MNELKYWFNGVPGSSIQPTNTDALTYWFNGSPEKVLLAEVSPAGDSSVFCVGVIE